jgi:GT2 family glycosyltransferase
MQQTQAGIVAGRIQVFPADPLHPTPVECYEMLFAFPQESYVRRHHFGVTANLLVQRSVFDTVGPFNASLMSGGDSEWGRRASASGHRIEYAPHCVIHHPARRHWKELATKLERTVAGRAALNDHSPSLIAQGGLWSIGRRIASCLLKQRSLPLRQRMAAATVIWRVDRTVRTSWKQAQRHPA